MLAVRCLRLASLRQELVGQGCPHSSQMARPLLPGMHGLLVYWSPVLRATSEENLLPPSHHPEDTHTLCQYHPGPLSPQSHQLIHQFTVSICKLTQKIAVGDLCESDTEPDAEANSAQDWPLLRSQEAYRLVAKLSKQRLTKVCIANTDKHCGRKEKDPGDAGQWSRLQPEDSLLCSQ